MTRNIFTAATLALALLGPASAADSIQPGLWRIDSKLTSAQAETDMAMGMLLQHLGKLPPEQRKAMEQMAANNGMTMPTIGADGGIGLSTCITPEMAARKQIPTGQPGDCTSHNVAVAGGMNMAFTCASPPSSGEGALRFVGERGFTMTMQVTTSARGAPERVTVNSTGQWLGASCPATARR
jgi:hypothetical protein